MAQRMGVIKPMKKLIYCNGDSFTAGVCLADSFLPEYPGHFSQDDLQLKRKVADKFIKLKEEFVNTTFVDYDQIRDPLNLHIDFLKNQELGSVKLNGCISFLEKKMAFPAQLTNIDKTIQVINASLGGASMGGIANRTILDLLEYKRKNITIDRVLIQLTSTSRYEFFNTSAGHSFINEGPIGYFPNNIQNKISELLSETNSNQDYLIKYMYHMTTMCQMINLITGKPPILIDSCNGLFISNDLKDTERVIRETVPYNLDYWNSIRHHSMIDTTHFNFMQDIAQSMKRPHEWDGHYNVEVHKLTAEKLINMNLF
jgi:hypothetical protein